VDAATDRAGLAAAFYRDFDARLTGTGKQAELTAQVLSDPACGGPWSAELQHGGPPSALLVLAAERLAAVATGRADLVAVRLAAEFIGPVPVAELRLRARISRLSRSAVLVTAELLTAGRAGADRVSLQARIWLLAPGEQAREPDRPAGEAVDPSSLPRFAIDSFPYAGQLEWRLVAGTAYQPGPARAWIRPLIPILGNQPLSSLQRAVLLGDSASGISAELDWQRWSFANVDLDLHLFRQTEGDWLLLDARTWLGAGMATTRSSVADRAGPAGFGLQTLLVRPSAG
jgi:hypothetical protein